jgi:hypothetical protein
MELGESEAEFFKFRLDLFAAHAFQTDAFFDLLLPSLLFQPSLFEPFELGALCLLALELFDLRQDGTQLLGFGLLPEAPLLAASIGRLFHVGELLHCALAGSPTQAADVAELRAAATRHVLAGFSVLNKGMAVEAAFPAFFIGQDIRQVHVKVLRAVLVAVCRPPADCACHMAALASALALVQFDVLGPDPDTAVRMAAVYSFRHGQLPL